MPTPTATPAHTVTIRPGDHLFIGRQSRPVCFNDVRSYVGTVWSDDGATRRDETPEESERSSRERGRKFRHDYAPIWGNGIAAVLTSEGGRDPAWDAQRVEDGAIALYLTEDGTGTLIRLGSSRHSDSARIEFLSGHFGGDSW